MPKFEKEIFNTMYSIIPIVSALYDDSVCIGITDREKYLYTQMGKNFQIPFHAGDTLNPFAVKVIEKGEFCKVSLPKHIMQTDSACYFFPLREENEVVGLFTVAVDLSYRNELISIIENLTNTIDGIYTNVKDVTQGFQNLSVENDELLQAAHHASDSGKDSMQIVSIIKGISSKTNLLGLNASIEAARAGEVGRGFSVVASQISSLSKTSKDSINKIETMLKDISAEITDIDDGLTRINDVSKSQSVALDGIVSSLGELDALIKKLNSLSKQI